MRLQALREQILDKAFEAMKDAIVNNKKAAGAGIGTDRYFIDLLVSKSGCVEAVITHYNDFKKDSKNVEAWCEGVLRELSWDEARKVVDEEYVPTFEEEYARHGESLFRKELQWHRIR